MLLMVAVGFLFPMLFFILIFLLHVFGAENDPARNLKSIVWQIKILLMVAVGFLFDFDFCCMFSGLKTGPVRDLYW
jgi:hypothetical protein